MNERIQKLMGEAFDTAEYPADQEYRIEPNKAFCKKFVELIVAECRPWLADDAFKEIKEHFEVAK